MGCLGRRMQRALRHQPREIGAAEQADAADEARLDACGTIIVGGVIVVEGRVVRASQLIRSVRQTVRVRARGKTSQMAHRILAGLLTLLICTTACVGLRPRTTLEGRPFDVANVQSIHPGLTEPDVRALLGEPYEVTVDGEHTVWRYYERFTPRGCDANPPTISQEFRVRFAAGHVVSTEGASPREKR
jgi:outer membrane protein assembly factor BamE (lipoprotein component of BamABCDE complex)